MRGLLFLALLLLSPSSWAQETPPAAPEAEPAAEISSPEPAPEAVPEETESPTTEPPPAIPEPPPEVTPPVGAEETQDEETPDPRPALIRNATFSRHGAGVLAPGQMSVGLFAPLRVGVLEDLELSAHPLLSLLSPQVEARKVWTGARTGL